MYFFIVNLTSRTGKARRIWIEIEKELKKRRIAYEAYVTEYAGHARKLAEELCTRGIALVHTQRARGEDGGSRHDTEKPECGIRERVCLVVVGGDGTANEVVNGMHHFDKIHFGYIPTGSGNDLCRGLGIPKHPLKALDNILTAKESYPMDLGLVTDGVGNSHRFAISSGIGIDADVCRMALTSRLKNFLNHVGLGSLTYVLLTVKALFTMPTTEVRAVFDGGAPKKVHKMIFVAGMNHPWEGGGVPMAPRADAQDGKLSVCMVYGIPRWKTFFLLPVLVKGKHEGRLKGFEIIDCERYELKLTQPMVLHADGEYLGRQTDLHYCCEKGKLLVLK